MLGQAFGKFVSLIAFCAAAAVASYAGAAPKEKLKIGFLSTLSGPNSELGQTHLEGFQLALELAGNRLGGVPVEVVIADDKLNPEVGLQAVRKFLTRDGVDLVTGVIFLNVTLAVYKPVVDTKTFFFHSFSLPGSLAGEQCNPYLFGTGYQTETPFEATGTYISEKLKIKRMAIIGANTPGGRDALTGFKHGYKGEVVGEIYSRFGQPDYSAELSQIRAAKPDAVFFQYSGANAITFVRQFHAAKLNIPLYSALAMDETTIHGMGDAAIGAYTVANYLDDLDNSPNRLFVKAYVAKFGRRPSVFAAYGYDTVKVIERAVSAVNGDLTKREVIRAELRRANFELVRGPMRFNTNQVAINSVYLGQVVKAHAGMRIEFRDLIMKDQKDNYSSKCALK